MANYTGPMRPEKRKIEPVVKGSVQMRQRGMLDSFKRAFFEEDITSVKERIIEDWIIPGIKDALLGTIEMIFYGSARRRSGSGASTGYTPYNTYSKNAQSTQPVSKANVQALKTMDYRDLTFDTRADAEDAYAELVRYISEYGEVSISGLFDAANVTNDNYQLEKYGWKSLPEYPRVLHTRDGRYTLDLPKPVSLM